MEIQAGRVYVIETEGPVKAFADIIIDGKILIKAFRVIEGKKGLFVSYPKERGKDNRWYDTVSAIDKETQELINTVILQAYAIAKTKDSAPTKEGRPL